MRKLTIPGAVESAIGSLTGNSSWAPAGLIYDGTDTLIAMQESPVQLVAFTQ